MYNKTCARNLPKHPCRWCSKIHFCPYCGGQVTALVSADPAQAADNIEHLELELRNRRGEKMKECYKWLLFVIKMHIVVKEQQETKRRSVSSLQHSLINCASRHTRFETLMLWKVPSTFLSL